MALSRSWLALVALAAFVTACGGGVVEPTTSDSSSLSLSAPVLVRADYGIDLKFIGGGLHSQEDVIVARDGGSGVSATGNWRSLIRRTNASDLEVRGTISCVGFVGGDGARLGGVVTLSSDPTLVGDVMVATVKDGGDDWSTGARFHEPGSGITALQHCQQGFSNTQIGIGGISTFQKVLKGFVDVFGGPI